MMLAAMLLAAACSTQDQALPIVRLGHAPHDHHAPLYVAASNPEYFREHGGVWLKELEYRKDYELISGNERLAHVTIDSSTGGKELVRKLAEDQFDVSFGGVPAMLSYIDRGSDIKILSPANFEGAGLIVRDDLPVRSWDDLVAYVRERKDPLRIGYKIALSVQNLIFEQSLDASGIRYSDKLDDDAADIILVNLHGPKNLIPALENGLIDGFVVNQPYLAQAQYQGVGRLVSSLAELPPPGRWRDYPCCAVAARDDFLRSQPRIAAALLDLLLRANRFISEYPQQSAAQIAQWLGTPVEVETSALASMRFRADMGPAWEHGMEVWIETMIERGYLTKRVREAHAQGRLPELLYPPGSGEAAE